MNKKQLERLQRLTASGEIYDCTEKEMLSVQHECVERLNRLNLTPDTKEGLEEREAILKEIFGKDGNIPFIIPPIYANWGLQNVHLGKDVVFNFNTCIVDDGPVYIGDNCMIAPGCHIITASHPISPALRKRQLQYNKPVRLGNNVWLGAGVTVLPGVTIGDNSVVGAGSVVTKDVEANTIVAGNPARVLRKITEQDDLFYDHDKPIPAELREQ